MEKKVLNYGTIIITLRFQRANIKWNCGEDLYVRDVSLGDLYDFCQMCNSRAGDPDPDLSTHVFDRNLQHFFTIYYRDVRVISKNCSEIFDAIQPFR